MEIMLSTLIQELKWRWLFNSIKWSAPSLLRKIKFSNLASFYLLPGNSVQKLINKKIEREEQKRVYKHHLESTRQIQENGIW